MSEQTHVGTVLPFAGGWEAVLSVEGKRVAVLYGMRPFLTVVVENKTTGRSDRYDFPLLNGLRATRKTPAPVATEVKRILKVIKRREWSHVIAALMPVVAPYWREGLSRMLIVSHPAESVLWSVCFVLNHDPKAIINVYQPSEGLAVQIRVGQDAPVAYGPQHKTLVALMLADMGHPNLPTVTEFDRDGC